MVGGEIKNHDSLVRVMSELKKELSLEYVKVAFPEERGYLFTAKIPIMSNKEVLGAIESKIEENVPVPPIELLFDYTISLHSEEGHLDVVVSAVPISVADGFIDVFQKAELSLLSLEIESQATARALLSKTDPKVTLIVRFDREKVGLYIAFSGIVRFTSTVIFPGRSGVVAYDPDPNSDLQLLSREVQKLYTYWHGLKENKNRPDRVISQIVVCGEDADRITRFLSENINTPAVLGNVWKNAFDMDNLVPEISFLDSFKYVAAIGLAFPNEVLI
jgi:Tfp pilus assembly PilM family ATPase